MPFGGFFEDHAVLDVESGVQGVDVVGPVVVDFVALGVVEVAQDCPEVRY